MYYIYVLRSLKDNKNYIGYSRDVHLRLNQHNTGQVASTKNRRPFKIIYTEEYDTHLEARRREFEIKRMKNGIQFKALLKTRE